MDSFKIGRYSYEPFNPLNPKHREFYQKLDEELNEEDSELL